jgi:hypothetical protein
MQLAGTQSELSIGEWTSVFPDAAMTLAVGEKRIEHWTAIIYRDVTAERYSASIRVDVHDGNVNAERECLSLWRVMVRGLEAILHALGHLSTVGGGNDACPRRALFRCPADTELTVG